MRLASPKKFYVVQCRKVNPAQEEKWTTYDPQEVYSIEEAKRRIKGAKYISNGKLEFRIAVYERTGSVYV